MRSELAWVAVIVVLVALASAWMREAPVVAVTSPARFVLNLEIVPTCGTGYPPTVGLRLVRTSTGEGAWRAWSTATQSSRGKSSEGRLSAVELKRYVDFLERNGVWDIHSTRYGITGIPVYRLHVENGKRQMEVEVRGSLLERPVEEEESCEVFQRCFSATLEGQLPVPRVGVERGLPLVR